MKIVVCDTGPILHLREINLFNLLDKAGKIVIPKTIDDELSGLNHSWGRGRPDWIMVQELPEQAAYEASGLYGAGLLHTGEAEAIVLAQHLAADWFLTDDTSARTFAGVLGLEVHGTLGILLWGAALRHLEYHEARRAIKRLSGSTLWISQNILQKAYRVLDDLFATNQNL